MVDSHKRKSREEGEKDGICHRKGGKDDDGCSDKKKGNDDER